LDRAADFTLVHYHIYKRPFLEEFLQEIQFHFNIAFWSSASDDYVEKLVDIIYPAPYPKEFVWGRKRCTPKPHLDEEGKPTDDGLSHYNYVKRLNKIKRKGYSLERTLMVDDTPFKIKNSYGNAIYIKEFNGDPNDRELKKLLQYLLTLKDMENVRLIEKRGWHIHDTP
jgi:RNA polymerase II subunit A small phosphatase-like protein